MEFIIRASSILHDGDVGLANAFKEFFGLQRAQLAAFKKMMLERDPEAEAEWLRLSGNTRLPHEQRRPRSRSQTNTSAPDIGTIGTP